MRSKAAQIQIARLRKATRPTNAAALALRLGIFSGTTIPSAHGKHTSYNRAKARETTRTQLNERWNE